MKKLLRLILAAALFFALSTGALAASGAKTANGDKLVGSYFLTGMEDSSGDNAAVLSTMAAMGVYITLRIDSDGSGVIDFFGEELELSFNFARKTVTLNDGDINFAYRDGILELYTEDMTMTFTKGEVSEKNDRLPFDYYVMETLVDAGDVYEPEDGETIPTLVLFSNNSAVLFSDDEPMPLIFDFDEMTAALADGEGVDVPFTLEDGLLTLTGGEDNYVTFRLSDPGWEGPYILTGLVTGETGDLSAEIETMAAMGLYITLEIDEDGEGTLDSLGDVTVMLFDFDAMTVTGEDGEDAIPFTYENGALTLAVGEESMSFRRVLDDDTVEELAEYFESSCF